MHAIKQGLEEINLMTSLSVELEVQWRDRLLEDFPQHNAQTRASIVRWLLGANPERFNSFKPNELAIARQAMEYRYRILSQRYLNQGPTQAYRTLIKRLGGLAILRNKIKTWVSLSRDRYRAIADVIQEIIQEMLNSDRYIQSCIDDIARCTDDRKLQNILLLASIEEYCLRPIRNQPLLVYRFVNYLRRSQRGGMTQVPQSQIVRMVSDEIAPDNGEGSISLLDDRAISDYEDAQLWSEQRGLRLQVQQEFERYLTEKVDPLAATWLQLYLQGHAQEAIAAKLDLPIKQVYRLREKVSYHAVKGFAMKSRPELVANWLQTSLKEHNLGLTPGEWQAYWQGLTAEQQQLLERLKAGETPQGIAEASGWKVSQVTAEWTTLYQTAQSFRSGN